ncbi:MAG: heme ABC transporter ATP-binding protein [Pseudomonadales bacterium]|jgi:iron complex transport system ATP-binding protein|nr:heme ABC transporter ATP-binding protein [Pseudomonadales bacterium]
MSLVAERIDVRVGDARLLGDVSVEIAPGELVVVLGPNGAGKSTLLSALAGDRSPDGGIVRLGETPLDDIAPERQAELRAVVAAPPQLAFDFTVADVVAMGWLHGERHGPDAHAHALVDILDACELADLADRVFMTLSSGERQRAQFARGLMQIWRPPQDTSPRWLLLDEPTANLDIAHAIGLLEALRGQATRGIGVLAIVHDLDLGARFADRIVLLEAGRIAAAGRPEEVMTSETLSRVYGTPVHVEYNASLDRLVVLA